MDRYWFKKGLRLPSAASQFLGKISAVNQTGPRNSETSNEYTIAGGNYCHYSLT